MRTDAEHNMPTTHCPMRRAPLEFDSAVHPRRRYWSDRQAMLFLRLYTVMGEQTAD